MQDREDTTLPVLRQQLADAEKGIENMLNAIQQGIITASTKTRLEELEAQKSDLEVSILQAQLQRPRYSKELVVNWISQFKYGDVNSREYQRRIIDTFVNSIYVFDDRLVFTYNFKGGTQTITLKEIEAAFGSDLVGMSPPSASSEAIRNCWLLSTKANILTIEANGYNLYLDVKLKVGQLTQLAECYRHMVEVVGSSPSLPTNTRIAKRLGEIAFGGFCFSGNTPM